MKQLHYEEWVNNRYQKIINILGRNWFKGKMVLELACAHGDIGKALLKCGADVYFSDIDLLHLQQIERDLSSQTHYAKVFQMDQNKPYSFDFKFDLILHFGVLYHLENWKQDLKCALEHTNLMFLETLVNPVNEISDELLESDCFEYSTVSGKSSWFTQKAVEQELDRLGCKYLCIKSQDLDTQWTPKNQGGYMRHLYSWDENIKQIDDGTHHRRFWIIMK